MPRSVFAIACAAAVTVCFASTSHGAVIAQYNFNTNANATTVAANVTAGALVNKNSGFDNFSASSSTNPVNEVVDDSDSGGKALFFQDIVVSGTDNSYDGGRFEVTITPDTGTIINYDSLTFYAIAIGGGVVDVNYSLDGGTTFLAIQADIGVTDASTPGNQTVNQTVVNLDGIAALQASATSVIFQIDPENNSGGEFAMDDLTLNGTAFVPEPASLALLALGSLCMLGRRRTA
jgi:hypothetical protein